MPRSPRDGLLLRLLVSTAAESAFGSCLLMSRTPPSWRWTRRLQTWTGRRMR